VWTGIADITLRLVRRMNDKTTGFTLPPFLRPPLSYRRFVQKIRLKDVAERAGVAVNTASTILNRRPNSWASKETEERVFKAAEELGYRPNRAAQSLRFGRFDAFALVLADFNDPFCAAFADAMEGVAESRGYELLIETSRNDPARESRILDELAHRNVDGVAVLAPAAAFSGGMPLVAISAAGATLPPVDAVLANFEPGLREAVAALLSLDHRRFALICGPGAAHLDELMRQLLPENGTSLCEFAQCGSGSAAVRDVSFPMFGRGAGARPTAVIAQNDVHAVGVMRAAAEAGLRIPHDISVVSMENSPLAARMPVALSAVAQPIAAMAVRAIEMLISCIEAGAARKHTEHALFATEFIRRESIGPAPGSA
jgi:LacI family transcriptional regulator